MTDLLLPSFLLCFVPLIAGCFTTNYYLGTSHNAIESKEVVLRDESEVKEEVAKSKGATAEGRSY
jgi:hypothetical protein